MSEGLLHGSGWEPDPYDASDHHASHQDVSPLFPSEQGRVREAELPPQVDLREWCGPVYFQGGFNTCNAHVVAGLLEYFEKRAFGRSVAPSRLFLYRVAKNFSQSEDLMGVYIRQVMGTLKLIGVPPEKFWPYPEIAKDPKTGQYPMDHPRLHEEPTSFCYALAHDYRAVTYYRLDHRDADNKLKETPSELLRILKEHLAHGVPTTIGFPMYHDVVIGSQQDAPGQLPYPEASDSLVGRHAVMVVGYDDARSLGGGDSSDGALLVKNSWGEDWGDQGYGWLSYDYLLKDRTRDLWTLTKADWTDTGQFQLGV